jgi:hypothetical protein
MGCRFKICEKVILKKLFGLKRRGMYQVSVIRFYAQVSI